MVERQFMLQVLLIIFNLLMVLKAYNISSLLVLNEHRSNPLLLLMGTKFNLLILNEQTVWMHHLFNSTVRPRKNNPKTKVCCDQVVGCMTVVILLS